MRSSAALLLASGLSLATSAALAQDATWPTFNGDLKAQKFSPATQITPDNVKTFPIGVYEIPPANFRIDAVQ